MCAKCIAVCDQATGVIVWLIIIIFSTLLLSNYIHKYPSFYVQYICKCSVVIPLCNGEGTLRDEICILKKVHHLWKRLKSKIRIGPASLHMAENSL